MRKSRKRRGRPTTENAKQRISLRLSTARKTRYEKAAKAAGKGLSAWIKSTLDRASK